MPPLIPSPPPIRRITGRIQFQGQKEANVLDFALDLCFRGIPHGSLETTRHVRKVYRTAVGAASRGTSHPARLVATVSVLELRCITLLGASSLKVLLHLPERNVLCHVSQV